MDERALALQKEQIAACCAFVDQALGSTGDVVRDHMVDGDTPASNRDSRLAGSDKDALAATRLGGIS